MTMDERMTLCNLSIEGGARMGYVNPDETTFAFLRGTAARAERRGLGSSRGLVAVDGLGRRTRAADDERVIDVNRIAPVVTWGTNPGQSVAVDEPIPDPQALPRRRARGGASRRCSSWASRPARWSRAGASTWRSSDRAPTRGCRICAPPPTSSAGSALARHVRGLVVPGSREVQRAAEREGLHEVFAMAGFEWREPGCSLCLGMNDDKLSGAQTCASSSNRNFRGRQGSPTGRTLLMSPAMVAAAAIAGEVVDVRSVIPRGGAVQ